jgi:hypothetical protein
LTAKKKDTRVRKRRPQEVESKTRKIAKRIRTSPETVRKVLVRSLTKDVVGKPMLVLYYDINYVTKLHNKLYDQNYDIKP